MPLRQSCPACGGIPAFRKEFGSGKKLVPWYKVAPVRLFCVACGAEVIGVVSSRVWSALTIWLLLLMAAFFGVEVLKENHIISAHTFQVVGLAIAFILWAGGVYIFRHFLEYKVVPEA